MKNSEIKKIITEAVIGFLNEAKSDPRKVPVYGDDFNDNPMVVPVKVKNKIKPIIHPMYRKNIRDIQPNSPGLNEEDIELPEGDKKEIEEIVRKTMAREGLLSFTFGTNAQEGKTTVGARVDPTAKGDWVLAKEELLYEMPIKYNNKLHEFVKQIRKSITS